MSTEDQSTDPIGSVHMSVVSMTIGSPPGQVGFTKAAKQALNTTLGINPRSIRGSYAILGTSLHPLMRQGSALRRNLSAIRDKWTIPEYGLKNTSASVDAAKMYRIAGSYLIENSNIEKFLEEYELAATQYLAWGANVVKEDNYEQIRDLDKANLGEDWEIIKNRYPSREALAASISCEMPKISPYAASFDLADVAPKTMAKLRQQMLDRLEATVSGATAELLVEFQILVEAVARTCGTKSRLNPPVSHPLYSELHLAEVVKKLNDFEIEQEGLDVPAGKSAYELQPSAKSDRGKGLKKQGESQIYIFSDAEYAALLPYETDEYRSLQTSSFNNLLQMADRIQTVASMLKTDEASEDLLDTVEKAKKQLLQIGSTPSQIANQTKNSSYVRSTLRSTMQQLSSSLQTQSGKIKRGVQRRISL